MLWQEVNSVQCCSHSTQRLTTQFYWIIRVKMLLVNGDLRKLWKTSKHTKQELRLWHHFKGSTTTLQGLKVARLSHQIRFKEEIRASEYVTTNFACTIIWRLFFKFHLNNISHTELKIILIIISDVRKI